MLGKHSGRHAFRERVKELGFELDDVEFERVFEEFKALADKKKELFDGDIEALVLQAEHPPPARGRSTNLRHRFATASKPPRPPSACSTATAARSRCAPRATARWTPRSRPSKAPPASHVGLRKFEVRSVTEGEDAQGEAIVYVEYNQRTYRGSSVSTNIVESATQAFLEVINRIELAQRIAHARATRAAQAAV